MVDARSFNVKGQTLLNREGGRIGSPVSHATLFGKVMPVTTPLESVFSGAKKCSSELSGSPGSSSDSACEKDQQAPQVR